MALESGKRLPVLRFKDDEGEEYPEWEAIPIASVGEVITGKTPSTTNKNLWNGNLQFITPTDIDDSKKYQWETNRYLRRDKRIREIPPNSIIYTCIASIGKICISVKHCSTNQQINSIIPRNGHYFEFIYYALSYATPRIKATQDSSTVPIINKSQFKKIKLSIPSPEEQQKIANFLSSVDTRIEQLEKKKALLEQYKKGLMQKLFSQEVRFKDDEGEEYPEWVEKNLSRVVDIKKGQQLNRDEMILGGNFPVINGGVVASGYTDSHNFKGNVITVSEGGNSCGYVGWQQKDFWLGGHCYALPVSSPSMDPDYLFYFLKNIEEQIMRLRVGSGLPNIQKRDLSELTISFPQVQEQQKIANLLSSFDKKVELVAEQINQTREFKKGLLQQMFVS